MGDASTNLPQVVAALYQILEPLGSSERNRALKSVLAMLVDDDSDPYIAPTSRPSMESSDTSNGSIYAKGKRAAAWVRKHKITDEQLEQLFANDNGKISVFSVPGTKKREQTINAYLLTGVQAFLAADDPKFQDSDAVTLCKSVGCFDQANHAQTRSLFGNRFSGTKESGYILTAPGQDEAATLIKNASTDGH